MANLQLDARHYNAFPNLTSNTDNAASVRAFYDLFGHQLRQAPRTAGEDFNRDMLIGDHVFNQRSTVIEDTIIVGTGQQVRALTTVIAPINWMQAAKFERRILTINVSAAGRVPQRMVPTENSLKARVFGQKKNRIGKRWTMEIDHLGTPQGQQILAAHVQGLVLSVQRTLELTTIQAIYESGDEAREAFAKFKMLQLTLDDVMTTEARAFASLSKGWTGFIDEYIRISEGVQANGGAVNAVVTSQHVAQHLDRTPPQDTEYVVLGAGGRMETRIGPKLPQTFNGVVSIVALPPYRPDDSDIAGDYTVREKSGALYHLMKWAPARNCGASKEGQWRSYYRDISMYDLDEEKTQRAYSIRWAVHHSGMFDSDGMPRCRNPKLLRELDRTLYPIGKDSDDTLMSDDGKPGSEPRRWWMTTRKDDGSLTWVRTFAAFDLNKLNVDDVQSCAHTMMEQLSLHNPTLHAMYKTTMTLMHRLEAVQYNDDFFRSFIASEITQRTTNNVYQAARPSDAALAAWGHLAAFPCVQPNDQGFVNVPAADPNRPPTAPLMPVGCNNYYAVEYLSNNADRLGYADLQEDCRTAVELTRILTDYVRKAFPNAHCIDTENEKPYFLRPTAEGVLFHSLVYKSPDAIWVSMPTTGGLNVTSTQPSTSTPGPAQLMPSGLAVAFQEADVRFGDLLVSPGGAISDADFGIVYPGTVAAASGNRTAYQNVVSDLWNNAAATSKNSDISSFFQLTGRSANAAKRNLYIIVGVLSKSKPGLLPAKFSLFVARQFTDQTKTAADRAALAASVAAVAEKLQAGDKTVAADVAARSNEFLKSFSANVSDIDDDDAKTVFEFQDQPASALVGFTQTDVNTLNVAQSYAQALRLGTPDMQAALAAAQALANQTITTTFLTGDGAALAAAATRIRSQWQVARSTSAPIVGTPEAVSNSHWICTPFTMSLPLLESMIGGTQQRLLHALPSDPEHMAHPYTGDAGQTAFRPNFSYATVNAMRTDPTLRTTKDGYLHAQRLSYVVPNAHRAAVNAAIRKITGARAAVPRRDYTVVVDAPEGDGEGEDDMLDDIFDYNNEASRPTSASASSSFTRPGSNSATRSTSAGMDSDRRGGYNGSHGPVHTYDPQGFFTMAELRRHMDVDGRRPTQTLPGLGRALGSEDAEELSSMTQRMAEHRFHHANRQADPIVRILLSALYTARNNKRTWEAMLSQDVNFPYNVVVLRPRVQIAMEEMGIGQYGGRTMENSLSDANYMVSRVEAWKEASGNLTLKHGTFVYRPELITVMSNVKPRKYRGGLGFRHFREPSLHSKKREIEITDPRVRGSIIPMIVPVGETAPIHMDMTGRPKVKHPLANSNLEDPNEHILSSLRYYNLLYGFSKYRKSMEEHTQNTYFQRPQMMSMIASRCHFQEYDPETCLLSIVNYSHSFMGRNGSGDTSHEVWYGGAFFKEQNYLALKIAPVG